LKPRNPSLKENYFLIKNRRIYISEEPSEGRPEYKVAFICYLEKRELEILQEKAREWGLNPNNFGLWFWDDFKWAIEQRFKGEHRLVFIAVTDSKLEIMSRNHLSQELIDEAKFFFSVIFFLTKGNPSRRDTVV